MSLQSSAPQQQPERATSFAGRAATDAAGWDDEEPLPRRWSASEAAALRGQRHAPSPWRVVAWQAAVGVAVSLLVGLVFGRFAMWSALYGAVTAVVPSALMARGATRMADVRSPMLSVMGLLGWESAKIIFSVAMLVVAARAHLLMPPLLAVLAACMLVYLAALRWRAP